MAYQILSVDAVAECLNLTPAEITQRVKCNEIPYQKRGRRIVFPKDEIVLWASQRLLRLPAQRLMEYHQKSTRGAREFLPLQTLLPEMVQPSFIAPALLAKTKSSVLHDLVALAETTGRLNNPHDLVASLEAREALCSTGMPGGFALLHPHLSDPYLFETSFIVLGRTVQQIYFGAPDSQPTDLFFLISCQDDRLHLHTLARICLMARKTAILNQLRQASDAQSMHQFLLAAEQEAMAETKT
jgi:mannitol/fructose-specific phosphotransferase system IIA component (Ntr-type)